MVSTMKRSHRLALLGAATVMFSAGSMAFSEDRIYTTYFTDYTTADYTTAGCIPGTYAQV